MNSITDNRPGITARSGNRCGHDPAHPRWFAPPPQHKPRPGILRKLADKARAYYTDPVGTLPSLNFAKRFKRSKRRQRSERRESNLSVLCVFLHYLDLVTLWVGIPQENDRFGGLTMDRIAQLAGIGLRRAERAVADLVAAGFVEVRPITVKVAPGRFKSRAAIRRVSPLLFAAFGLGEWLRYEREKARARRRKQERKVEAQARAKLALTIKGAIAVPARAPSRSTGTETGGAGQTVQKKEHRYSDMIRKLKQILTKPP